MYLIGSVTMSWWVQGKPDVEEVHAALSDRSIDSRITSNSTLINAPSRTIPNQFRYAGLSYPGLIWGQEESRLHRQHSKLDTFIRKLPNACTGRSSIGRSLTPLRMANPLQQHSSGC